MHLFASQSGRAGSGNGRPPAHAADATDPTDPTDPTDMAAAAVNEHAATAAVERRRDGIGWTKGRGFNAGRRMVTEPDARNRAV